MSGGSRRLKKPQVSKPIIKVSLEGPSDGAFNMSEDLNLFHQAEKGKAAFRVYAWESGPWVSMGRFQPIEDVEASFPGYRLVRRPSGGAAVRHVDEVTFSLAIPLSLLSIHPEANQGKRSVRAVYQAVSQAVVYAVSGVHQDARLGTERRRTGSPQPLDCFDMVDGPDVVDAQGRKLAGSALKVGREAVLLQVSIPVGSTRLTHLEVFARLVDFVRFDWGLETESDILTAPDFDRRSLSIHTDWAPLAGMRWEEARVMYNSVIHGTAFNLEGIRAELVRIAGRAVAPVSDDAIHRIENHFLPGLGASC